MLEKLEIEGIDKKPYVLYKQEPVNGYLGFCSEYYSRPLIWRLSGSGTSVKRNGKRELLLSKFLKDKYRLNPGLIELLQHEFPLGTALRFQVGDFNIDMDSKLYPINTV